MFSKSAKLGFVAILILLSAVSMRLYYLEQKHIVHMDEILSIILSEYNEYGWTKHFDTDRIWTAKQMRAEILWNDPTFQGALRDVKALWHNNRDDPHTNLYYSLLRLWHIGYVSSDIESTFARGVWLNIIFFLFAFYFAFMLSKRLFGDSWLLALFLAIAFFNPASISNTLFIRPYALQEACFLCFCYVFLIMLQKSRTQALRQPLAQSKSAIKYMKVIFVIWTLCALCAILSFSALLPFAKQSRQSTLIVHSSASQPDGSYIIRGKMMFQSVIFANHAPHIVVQPKLDSIAYTRDLNVLGITIEDNPRYLSLRTMQPLDNGLEIGTLSYEVAMSPFSFYLTVLTYYVVGLVLLICIFYSTLSRCRDAFLLAFVSALLLLSGYFAALFVGMVYFLAFLWVFCRENIKKVMFFIASFALSLVLCIVLYPRYFSAISGGRGKEVGDKLNFAYVKTHLSSIAQNFMDILVDNISLSVVFVGVCGIVIALFYMIKRITKCKTRFIQPLCHNNMLFVFILGILALIWAFVVIVIAPYKDLRYIMAIFPIMCLLPMLFFIYVDSIRIFCVHKIQLYRIYAHRILLRGGGGVKMTLCCLIGSLWCVYSVLPLERQSIASLAHSRFVLSDTYKNTRQTVIAYLQDSVFYASLILPYLEDDKEVIFISSCDALPTLIHLYRTIEFLSDGKKFCALQEYAQKPLYEIGGIKSVLLSLKE